MLVTLIIVSSETLSDPNRKSVYSSEGFLALVGKRSNQGMTCSLCFHMETNQHFFLCVIKGNQTFWESDYLYFEYQLPGN